MFVYVCLFLVNNLVSHIWVWREEGEGMREVEADLATTTAVCSTRSGFLDFGLDPAFFPKKSLEKVSFLPQKSGFL